MATLVLSAVGTAVGGPLGGAIGGLIGRQVDQAAFGGSSREGPRLKELAVTTSSYGQPIPRVFGRMRVAGSVIWSTELVETSSTEGGKGQPSTTNYSYSASFAVAVSSTPINRIGRIWADGNLLRGAQSELKVEGEMRSYLGSGNDPVDPLISAEKGNSATAFRDCAYIVFENLQLADFGNRIPALTFEVFGADETSVSLPALVPPALATSGNSSIGDLRGFADDGGSLSTTLSAIDRVLPLSCTVQGSELNISSERAFNLAIPTLPEQLSSRNADEASSRLSQRGESATREPLALRYYDEGRDYQPGVQRANGLRAEGREAMVDLPATMTADDAKKLANENARNARLRKDQIVWRIGQLDPAIQPSTIVRVPDTPGFWRITSWEWYDRGVELVLERTAPENGTVPQSDSGAANLPDDLEVPITELRFFELPSTEESNTSAPILYAAASGANAAWNGATLYAENGGSLEPIGSTGIRRALLGTLSQPLGASNSLLFEPESTLSFSTSAHDLPISPADLTGIANGANRILVEGEVVQFTHAAEVAPGEWQLTGLLRGRGGTEEYAATGHSAGSRVTILDDRLVAIGHELSPPDTQSRIAAIGRGDSEPTYAALENAGLSRRPLTPVHARATMLSDGSTDLCWTRRARGQWRWDSLFELPLIEEQERYIIGFGPAEQPLRSWYVDEPRIILAATELQDLVTQYGTGEIWVRQIGTYSQSSPLRLIHVG